MAQESITFFDGTESSGQILRSDTSGGISADGIDRASSTTPRPSSIGLGLQQTRHILSWPIQSFDEPQSQIRAGTQRSCDGYRDFCVEQSTTKDPPNRPPRPFTGRPQPVNMTYPQISAPQESSLHPPSSPHSQSKPAFDASDCPTPRPITLKATALCEGQFQPLGTNNLHTFIDSGIGGSPITEVPCLALFENEWLPDWSHLKGNSEDQNTTSDKLPSGRSRKIYARKSGSHGAPFNSVSNRSSDEITDYGFRMPNSDPKELPDFSLYQIIRSHGLDPRAASFQPERHIAFDQFYRPFRLPKLHYSGARFINRATDSGASFNPYTASDEDEFLDPVQRLSRTNSMLWAELQKGPNPPKPLDFPQLLESGPHSSSPPRYQTPVTIPSRNQPRMPVLPAQHATLPPGNDNIFVNMMPRRPLYPPHNYGFYPLVVPRIQSNRSMVQYPVMPYDPSESQTSGPPNQGFNPWVTLPYSNSLGSLDQARSHRS